MKYVMGVDLGTSSLKIILVNKEGQNVYAVNSEYDIESIKSGFSEQNPQIWVNAFEDCLSKINSLDSTALGEVEARIFQDKCTP
ncbi:FGGY family carbohydrate kinase [Spiroplasma clarkii]|uniref:FGGY family carbohydrate kinase n=1 Tax=Spiroplasma clarkii TaxID=2139 RepID=UPI000C20FEFD|nr:FGGY family carbohydrate kinase [Spiroplasma clarkii]